MHTIVNNLEGLNKQLVVEIPIADFNIEFDKALNDLKTKVNIDGFRQGKTPLNIIKQKYGASIKTDTTNNMVADLLPKAFAQEKLNPAGQPALTKIDFETINKFIFSVEFEVFPVVELNDLSQLKIQKTISQITKADEDKTLEDLKDQAAEFTTITTVSKNGNKLKIDFTGLIDGKEFEGSAAKNFTLVLGKGSMIPGFDEGLVGKKAGESTKLKVVFPKDYQIQNLAGKQAIFEVKILEVSEAKKIEVDDKFAKKFAKNNIVDLLSGIKKQMQYELSKRLDSINRDASFAAVTKANELEVPKASVENEAQYLLDDMKHNLKQQGMPQNDKLEVSSFFNEATRRVKIGLLIADIVAKNNIVASKEQVEAKLQQMAAQYGEKKDQMLNYYHSNQKAMDGVHSMVVEKLASDFIFSQAKITEIKKDFNEIVGNLKQ